MVAANPSAKRPYGSGTKFQGGFAAASPSETSLCYYNVGVCAAEIRYSYGYVAWLGRQYLNPKINLAERFEIFVEKDGRRLIPGTLVPVTALQVQGVEEVRVHLSTKPL